MIHTEQSFSDDCGIAVVLTIAKLFKKDVTKLSNYLKNLEISDSNLSLYDLNRLLECFGIKSDAFYVSDFDELLSQNFPVIMKVDPHAEHYIVLLSNQGHKIRISDPAKSKITTISKKELQRRFDNYAIIIQKGEKTDNVVIDSLGIIDTTKIISTFVNLKQVIFLYIFSIISLLSPAIATTLIADLNVFSLNFLLLLISLFLYATSYRYLVHMRLKIVNNFTGYILDKCFRASLSNIGQFKMDTDISRYFWNLFGASNGIINRYFLRFDFTYLIVLASFLLIYDLKAFFAYFATLFILILMLINPINNLINDVKEMIEASGIWTNNFLEMLRGNLDIHSFNKSIEATNYHNSSMNNYFKKTINVNNSKILVTNIINIGMLVAVLIATLCLDRETQEKGMFVYLLFIASSGFSKLISNYIDYASSKTEIEFIYSRIDIPRTKELEHMNDFTTIDKVTSIEVETLAIPVSNSKIINYPKMKFESGNAYLIIGENGVGKSTLFRFFLEIYPNYTGLIKINNQETEKNFSLLKFISYYSTDSSLFSGRADRNIDFSIFDANPHKKVVNDFQLDGIPSYIHGNGDNISSGQKQKILLLRTLNKNSDIYLFDEPTVNLDYESKQKFFKYIEELIKNNKIVIVISHDSLEYDFNKIYSLGDK